MNLTQALIDGELFGPLSDAACASEYGGLLTAQQLFDAIVNCPQDPYYSLLTELMASAVAQHPETPVVKVFYNKYGDMQLAGCNLNVSTEGVPLLFGAPIPKGVMLAIGKDSRKNSEGIEYYFPTATLTVMVEEDGEKVPMALDVPIASPPKLKGAGYMEWCKQAVDLTKKTLLTAAMVGPWMEPVLSSPKISLADVEVGLHQVIEIITEQKTSAAGKPYTAYGLKLMDANNAVIETWPCVLPRCINIGSGFVRHVAMGKPLYLAAFGKQDQVDKDGCPVEDSQGIPYQELVGKVATVPIPVRSLPAAKAPKQMRSAADDFDIVEAQSGALALAGDW